MDERAKGALDERAKGALENLLRAGKYADVCRDTVTRVFAEELAKRANVKDADKAARARLHAITGAFMTQKELKRARTDMDAYLGGDKDALSRALGAHASTRERLASAEALYARAFQVTGAPSSVIDFACGLNPLHLGAMGLTRVLGVDIHAGCVRLINDCALRLNWDVRAETRDLLACPELPCAELGLFMKLLPVLESQKQGGAMQALARANCRYLLVTFPTRTLGGRGVGMEKHYSEWMEARADDVGRVRDRFIAGAELVYVLEKETENA